MKMTDMECMIKLMPFLLLPLLLSAKSPFESKEGKVFDTSVFDSRQSGLNKEASENNRIKCRVVCDKKIYKEQKIAQAVEFYKRSKYYGFNKN